MALTNMPSDFKSNPSSGLCINFIYTRCTYSQCMPRTHLNDLCTNTCGLVCRRGRGMCMGLSSTKCEKQSVRTTLKEFRGCERGFEPRGYSRFSRRPRALFASLGAAGHSRTHRSRRGLHSVVAAFTLCLLFHFRARLLALSSSLPSQFLPFSRRDNETASAASALRTINCTQLF